jgi:hypothetical protein
MTITPCLCESDFINEHLHEFIDRFDLGCFTEGLCSNYYITDHKDHHRISSSLVLSLNTFARRIHVSRFYPEIYKEAMPKYMSATCFYMLVHHFAQSFHLDRRYTIYLETRTEIFHAFYEKLDDFDLAIKKEGIGSGNVDILGHYTPSPMIWTECCFDCPYMEIEV